MLTTYILYPKIDQLGMPRAGAVMQVNDTPISILLVNG